jgi:hypothetical protein
MPDLTTGSCGYTHKRLNPWVTNWPMCGCANPHYDPDVPEPQTFEELLVWAEKRDEDEL